MPDQVPIDVAKAAIKEACEEWLDKQFALVGKWTVGGILSLALAGLFWAVIRYARG